VQPTVALNPTTLAFGEHSVGVTPNPTLTVTVTNAGSGTLTLNSPTFTGMGSSAYSVTPTTLSVTGPNGTGQLTVTFAPGAVGSFPATLTLNTNEVGKPTVSVGLTGTGVLPTVALSPTTLAFGDVPVGGPFKPLTLTVSNTGTGTVSIGSPTFSGTNATFYTISPSTLSVPAGQSRDFTVTFSPTAEGDAPAELSLTSNEVGNSTVTVPLSGHGGRPTAALNLAQLSFGSVRETATKRLPARLSNTGRAPLIISQAPTSSNPTIFSYVGPSSATIQPGNYMEFEVAFSPPANQLISYTGTLTITSNATNPSVVLSLEGTAARPQLVLDRNSISFGDVRVGSESTPPSVFTISNTSQAEVMLQNLSVTGPFIAKVKGGLSLPRAVKAGSPVEFEVIFKPTAEGAVPATSAVSVGTDLNNQTLTVQLTGNGTVSKVQLSSKLFDFKSQRVGYPSGVQPVVITNTGAAELEITQLIFSNLGFALSPAETLPLKVGAGVQKALTVAFTPGTLGPAEGKLFIISNASTPADPVELMGIGVDGQMTVLPSSVISFDPTEVGGSGLQKPMSLKNTGKYTLKITSVESPANTAFTVSGLPSPLVLQPDETWPFTVIFTPQRRGYVTTSAIIKSDAVTNPQLSLALEGTGVAAAVELQPQGINFGKSNVGVSTTKDISINNIGEKDLYVSNVSFTDSSSGNGPAQDFSLGSTAAFPLVIKAGESKLVQLKFTPRVVGSRQAKVVVFTNDKDVTADLVGEGTSAKLSLSPAELKFGNVLVGNPSAPRAIKITNTGTGKLTLNPIVLTGADASTFIMSSPTSELNLDPGAFTEVPVSLRPTAERLFSAQLVVSSNDASTPSVVVPLSGAGVTQQIQLSTSSLDFGQVLINNRSGLREVTITNSSNDKVTLTALSVEGVGGQRFSLENLKLPLVLEAQKEQKVGLYFTPQEQVDVNCVLKITFSDLPLPLEVALHGKGIPAVLSVNPSPLDFGGVRAGRGTSRELPLTFTNLSSEPITLAEPVVISSTGEAFAYSGSSVKERKLEPGVPYILMVGYQPLNDILSDTTLAFGTTTPNQPRAVEVQMKGRGIKSLLTVDAGNLDFGRVDVGKPVELKTITITNRSGQKQLAEVKLGTDGTPYTLGDDALIEAIPPEGQATFTVAFNPNQAGEVKNTVEVRLKGQPDTEAVIAVTGHGRALTGSGGGCSTTSLQVGSTALLALLALVGLSSRRRRRE